MMRISMMTSSNVRLCRASKLRLKRTTKRKRQRLKTWNKTILHDDYDDDYDDDDYNDDSENFK